MPQPLRYPYNAFTDATDYLQIDIVEYTPIRKAGNNTSFAGTAKSRNIGQGKEIKKTIFLPMPNQIKDDNSVKYAESELNSIAGAALGGITNMMDAGKALNPNQIINELKKSGEGFFKNTSEAVGGLAGAQGFVTRRLAAGAVNILGANINAGQILARGTGELLNPNTEVLFNGVVLRNFGFSFKMSPRNDIEAEQIKEIIRTFKFHSAAKLGSRQEGIKDLETFIRTPDIFELRYKKGNQDHPFLHKFKQCFLETVNINYTGDGVYSTFHDGTPVSMEMDLKFKEIEPIYDQDQKDAQKRGVGF
jgi:hypothetical protein